MYKYDLDHRIHEGLVEWNKRLSQYGIAVKLEKFLPRGLSSINYEASQKDKGTVRDLRSHYSGMRFLDVSYGEGDIFRCSVKVVTLHPKTSDDFIPYVTDEGMNWSRRSPLKYGGNHALDKQRYPLILPIMINQGKELGFGELEVAIGDERKIFYYTQGFHFSCIDPMKEFSFSNLRKTNETPLMIGNNLSVPQTVAMLRVPWDFRHT